MTDLPEYATGKHRFVLGFPTVRKSSTRSIMAAPIITDSGRRFVMVAELESSPMLTMVSGRANLGQTGEVVVARVWNGRLQLMDPLQDQQLRDRQVTSWPLLAESLPRRTAVRPNAGSPRPRGDGGCASRRLRELGPDGQDGCGRGVRATRSPALDVVWPGGRHARRRHHPVVRVLLPDHASPDGARAILRPVCPREPGRTLPRSYPTTKSACWRTP